MAVESRVITYYEVQMHYDQLGGWARPGWADRFLDLAAAEAAAEAARERLAPADDVRVIEASIEAIGPVTPVTVTAPNIYAIRHAVAGAVRGMEADGFVVVDHSDVSGFVTRFSDPIDRSVTVTFVMRKDD